MTRFLFLILLTGFIFVSNAQLRISSLTHTVLTSSELDSLQ